MNFLGPSFNYIRMFWPFIDHVSNPLTLFYPGSGKTLLPGGGAIMAPPGFLALGPPKAQN